MKNEKCRVHAVIAARNREWILERYVGMLYDQLYRPYKVSIVDNSSVEEKKQREVLEGLRDVYGEWLEIVDYPAAVDEKYERGEYTRDTFSRNLNKMFEVFREGDGDKFFLCDSDQIIGRDGIDKLVKLDKPCSGLIIRTAANIRVLNILCKYEEKGSDGVVWGRAPLYERYERIPVDPFQVDFVSGCVMLGREVVEVVKSEDGHAHWEWGSVWEEVERRGIEKPWIDPRVRTEHYMNKTGLPWVWEGK